MLCISASFLPPRTRQQCHTPLPPVAQQNTQAHHLVCQDAVDAVVVQVDEPVQALHLVLAQLAAGDDRGLHLQAVPRLLRAALLIAQQLLVLLLLGAACGGRKKKRGAQARGREASGSLVPGRNVVARLGGRGSGGRFGWAGIWVGCSRRAGRGIACNATVQHGAAACLRRLHEWGGGWHM